MGLSTPVPVTSAGERLISLRFVTRGGGSGTGIVLSPRVKLTQPETEKKKKSTSPQMSPWIR